MTRSFFAAVVGFTAIVLGSAPSSAQMAYITNGGDNTVSVIDTATNTVMGTIPVGGSPLGVAVTPDGSMAYITNTGDNTVSVINTAANSVVGTITVVGFGASVVAVSPDGSKVYVTSYNSTVCAPGTRCSQALISVIDTATNTVVGTIPLPIFTVPEFREVGRVLGLAAGPDGSTLYVSYAVGIEGTVRVGGLVIDTATSTVAGLFSFGAIPPSLAGVAVTLDGSKVYFSLFAFVAVIDTATNTVTALIPVSNSFCGDCYGGLAVTPDGSKVYVVTIKPGTTVVSVIDTATNTVVGLPIPVGSGASGIAVTPDGSKVYVANRGDNTVSVIDTATNTVVAVPPVGNFPIAFGVFIQPRFAGTIGDANCYGQSISALAQTFGGLNAAAIALGFPTVQGLQTAVNAFCGA